jgi:uncharacterized phage infection (PIP) family protein YhgE
MLAENMRRLAEEIADAYEERVRSISEIKVETAEKLAGFRADLEDSNRERAERVQAELKEMGDTLRSDLNAFRSGLAQFKDDLDEAEIGRKAEAREEISERSQHIANLRKDTLNLVNDFENARKDMWRRLKSDLEDFTSALTSFRVDLAGAHKERVEMVRAQLKEMGDTLRSDLKAFMSLLAQFKADLDKAERVRKEEALGEIAERRRDVGAVLEGTRDLLKEFGTARQEMWDSLKSQLEVFTSELAQFKADLDKAETDRQETMGQDLKEKAQELRSTLSGFTSELSAGVAEMMGQLNKDRGEATRAWSQILSAMRMSRGEKTTTPPIGAKPVVRPETVPEAVQEKTSESLPEEVAAERAAMPEPAVEADVKAEPEEKVEEELDQREGLISEILGLLEENPNGLRMVELAETLGVENWRSLIPIMRELLDDGDVKKEDSTYFIT